MLRERHALVHGEPVSDEEHEVLERGLEVVVARDRDRDVRGRGDDDPDEPRYALDPSLHPRLRPRRGASSSRRGSRRSELRRDSLQR